MFKFELWVIGVDVFRLLGIANGDETSGEGKVGEEVEALGVLGKPKLGGAEIVTKSGAMSARISVRWILARISRRFTCNNFTRAEIGENIAFIILFLETDYPE